MASKKVSEGVGKKIVEALKKQSEIEITPIVEENNDFDSLNDELTQVFETEEEELENVFEETNFLDELTEQEAENHDEIENDEELHKFSTQGNEEETMNSETAYTTTPMQQFISYQQPIQQETFINELDNFEIPNNIAVLKKLISQLPSGVTRHTGAQIIKQTMEALGISMKSVLQEAQQVQDGLNASAKECQATIQEYKKQIQVLEKQSQNYQKQYSALNELISLFVQTGI